MKILNHSTPSVVRFALDWQDIHIQPKNIQTVLGYNNSETPEHFTDMIQDIIAQAGDNCEILGGYQIYSEFERLENKTQIRVHDVVLDVGKIISTQLRYATSAALFVCTIGPQMETWAKDLMQQGDFLNGYLVDAVASEAVEMAMDRIQDHLEAERSTHGLHITNRYSPGYCGWHVSEQHKLFSLLPHHFCDISLTESSLMVPIKSVSGIIGIGTGVKKVDYTCRFCDMENCIYRRRKQESLQD